MTKKQNAWRLIVTGIIISVLAAATMSHAWIAAMQAFIGGILFTFGLLDLENNIEGRKG